MIKKLKRKFIVLATISMFILMTFLVGIMNAINYSTVVHEADTTIDIVSQPNAPFFDVATLPGYSLPPIDDFIPSGMSPEVPYESRFFTAMVTNETGKAELDISRIISVSGESAEKYVEYALNSNSDRGFIGSFRFAKTSDDKVTRIVFLDCGRKLDSFKNFMRISIVIGLLGCMIAFIIFLLFSGRIVRPIAESHDKQKRFITDAGHEIKTPLTIINANLDLVEDEISGSEYLAEIRLQTRRLAELTNDLVYLSKMSESENHLQKVSFSVSELVCEIADSFRVLAITQQKEYVINVQPKLSCHGSPDAIRHLAAILLDNAMKYSPVGGIIKIELAGQRRMIRLSVFNTTADKVPQDQISHLFERFYRADSSRNSMTGGHGIGLSIAQAITEAHGGKICAKTNAGSDLQIDVYLPQ